MFASDSRSLLLLLLGCWTIFFLTSCGQQASTKAGMKQTVIMVATPAPSRDRLVQVYSVFRLPSVPRRP